MAQLLLSPPPTQMTDDSHQPALTPTPAPTYNPPMQPPTYQPLSLTCQASMLAPWSLLSLFPELLIHLAIAKKLEHFQTTIPNAKAKADHTQQVATSALNAAPATASASRTYAQMAAAPPKPSPPPPFRQACQVSRLQQTIQRLPKSESSQSEKD